MKPELTDAPPARALDWVRKAVGRGSDVLDVRPLAGSTSAVHALTARTASGAAIRLVLRRYVRPEYLASEGDPPGYETNALRLLDGGPVPAPRLVAADVTGDECDVPAVLMTLLPGEPRKPPPAAELADYLRGLAEPLPGIHSTPVNRALRPYRPYFADVQLRPPFWAKDPAMWERAIAIHIGPVPQGSSFIHRDYHPGNVLWLDNAVQGVVDWANASAGHPHADIGHCRENLCTVGPDVAERFLDAYRAVSGDNSEYDPYWDIAAAVGWAPISEEAPDRPDLYESFVARAVARAART
ncbi:aminoglycoside phosphotransferase family protein [Actinosynnema sp. NPDC023794]